MDGLIIFENVLTSAISLGLDEGFDLMIWRLKKGDHTEPIQFNGSVKL